MKTSAVACGCILFVLAGECGAQSSLIQISPLGRDRSGWSLYSAAVSFGYSTVATPTSSSLPAFSLERLESDYDGTASASLGYNFNGRTLKVSLLYSPSYVRRVQYADLKAFNQSFNLTVSRPLGPRWDFSASAVATDSTLDQLLFTPAILSATTSPVATVDDLIQAARAGQYTSDQLASFLTGTPYVATPSRSVIYGSSFFSTSFTSGVTYRHTPRLSFSFAGGVTRSQTRNDSQKDLQGQLNYLIPHATSEQAGFTATYSLSPRTQVGGQVNASRIDSTLSRYYTTGANLFLSRKLTPHWFASISGGTGVFSEPRAKDDARIGYTAQGSLGYTTREHSWTGSYNRSISDAYGFASQSSEAIYGSWQWQPTQSSWSLYAGGGSQRMIGGILGDLRYFYGNAGVARSLSRQFSLNFTVGYVNRPTNSGNVSGALEQSLSGYSTRVTLVWSPQAREGRTGTIGGAAGAAGPGVAR